MKRKTYMDQLLPPGVAPLGTHIVYHYDVSPNSDGYIAGCGFAPGGCDFGIFNVGSTQHIWSRYPKACAGILSLNEPNYSFCKGCASSEGFKKDLITVEIGYDGDEDAWRYASGE